MLYQLAIPPTSTNIPTSNINPTSTTAGSAMNDKGKQPQVRWEDNAHDTWFFLETINDFNNKFPKQPEDNNNQKI